MLYCRTPESHPLLHLSQEAKVQKNPVPFFYILLWNLCIFNADLKSHAGATCFLQLGLYRAADN